MSSLTLCSSLRAQALAGQGTCGRLFCLGHLILAAAVSSALILQQRRDWEHQHHSLNLFFTLQKQEGCPSWPEEMHSTMLAWCELTRHMPPRAEEKGGFGNGSVAGDDGSTSYTLSLRCKVDLSSCFAEQEFSGILWTEVAGGCDAMWMSEVFPWLLLNWNHLFDVLEKECKWPCRKPQGREKRHWLTVRKRSW